MTAKTTAKITIVVVFTLNLRAATGCLHLAISNSESRERLRVKRCARSDLFDFRSHRRRYIIVLALPDVATGQRNIRVR